jgi:hypothetical protein
MNIIKRLWRAFSSRRPPAPCSTSLVDRKAYHVATAASDIVWGGEHGWERNEVGEYELARALRKHVRDLKRQNNERGG